MVVKYFNLKRESKNVFGGNIRVNASATDLDEKLSDFNGDFAFSSWNFKFIGEEKGQLIYQIIIPNEEVVSGSGRDALGGRIGIPVALDNGDPTSIKMRLSSEGDLSFYDSKIKGFYLNEITEEKARDMGEKASNWAIQRAYMVE